MTDYKWWKEHARLWDELVPASGQCETVQGEIVRCIGKLTDEAYRNGNCNWGDGHRRMTEYVEAVLLSDDTFTEDRKARIRADAAEIMDSERPNLGGHGTCYYNLTEAVVDWCLAKEALIPRDLDPELYM